MTEANVALLIDWENLKYSTTKDLGGLPDIITLKKISRNYGKLIVARAYANWGDISHTGDAERIAQQNIDPVFVMTRTFTDASGNVTVKGSVDLRLAVEATELLFANPVLTCFVIVSGDGGFMHLARKLREHGKHVVVIAVRESLSPMLGAATDELVLYNTMTEGLKLSPTKLKVPEALKRFRAAVVDIHETPELKHDISLQAVKARMRDLHPDFEEEKIGIPTFRHLAYLAEKLGYVRIDSTTEPAEAYLKDEGTAKNGRPLFSCEQWIALIGSLKENVGHNWGALQGIALQFLPDKSLATSFLNNAVASKILWVEKSLYFNPGRGGAAEGSNYLLNPHHPKVQVYKQRK